MAPSKTRGKKTKKLIPLAAGDRVMYIGISPAPAVILKVHHDDGDEKYYTIRFDEDGRERQTDAAHLNRL